jgi:hypothetical protein
MDVCVCSVFFFCFYIVSSETASRPKKKRLMRTYHWISLFMSYKVSKLAYRIWVILIANKRVKKSSINEFLNKYDQGLQVKMEKQQAYSLFIKMEQYHTLQENIIFVECYIFHVNTGYLVAPWNFSPEGWCSPEGSRVPGGSGSVICRVIPRKSSNLDHCVHKMITHWVASWKFPVFESHCLRENHLSWHPRV